jgi:hypothetical protein
MTSIAPRTREGLRAVDLLCSRSAHRRERAARWSLVLAQRGTREKKDQPGQSSCSRNAAHQINLIFRLAVLVHARTYGLIQAAPGANAQASLEGVFIRRCSLGKGASRRDQGWAGEKRCAHVRDQSGYPPKWTYERAWRDHEKRAVGDQSALVPEEENKQAWGDYLRAQWDQHGCHSTGTHTS